MQIRLNRFAVVYMIAVAALSLVCSSAFAKDEIRTWTDSTGKNKIKAKFVKLEDDKVTLEDDKGEEIEIPLKKLSAADQKFAAEAAKEDDDNPFKSKSDDPFKPKSKSKKTSPADESADVGSNGPRTVTFDMSAADHISLAASDEWQVEVKATENRIPPKPKPIAIPNKTEFFDGLRSVVFSHGTPKVAVVGFTLEKPADSNVIARIAICDVSTGKPGTPAVCPGKMIPIAVHDDGRQVVMRSEDFGFGKHDRLEIWIPKGKKVSKTIAWKPYDTENGGARDVTWADFISPDQLATCNSGGKIVIWKYPEIEPICYFDTEDKAIPALSPDRKLIAYSDGLRVGLFDIEKKEVVAQQQTPQKLQWPNMAFSPSGKRIACVAFDKVLVWDVASGALEQNIPCTGLMVNGNIEFPDDNFVLVGKQYLIELENQIKLWTYAGAEHVQVVDGVTYFSLTDGDKKPGAILPMQLPHPAARDLLKKAQTDPNLFILKAGTSVRIDINGIPDPAQKERVANALSKQLEAIGCKGGTTGTIDLVASMEGPKDTKLGFRHAGEYGFKEYIAHLKIVFEGQTAWQSYGSNKPVFRMTLKEGENIESHLRSIEKPGYGFFDKVQLPKYLQKPMAGKGAGNSLTIGRSQITTAGLR